jgi:precorrin-2 dehydrogenase/sirohydrochlorin ferrochelatase
MDSEDHREGFFMPVLIRTDRLNALIVGGGKIGLRKATELNGRVKSLRVVAPNILPEFKKLDQATLSKRPFEINDLKDTDLLYVAVDSPLVRDQIYVALEDFPNIKANFVDWPPYCDFYTPAILREGLVTIAVSSDGKAPRAAIRLKEELQKTMDLKYWSDFFTKASLERFESKPSGKGT